MTDLRLSAKPPAEVSGGQLIIPARWQDEKLVLEGLTGFSRTVTRRICQEAAAISSPGSTDPIRLPSVPDVAADTVVIAIISGDDSVEDLRRAIDGGWIGGEKRRDLK